MVLMELSLCVRCSTISHSHSHSQTFEEELFNAAARWHARWSRMLHVKTVVRSVVYVCVCSACGAREKPLCWSTRYRLTVKIPTILSQFSTFTRVQCFHSCLCSILRHRPKHLLILGYVSHPVFTDVPSLPLSWQTTSLHVETFRPSFVLVLMLL